MNVVKFILKVVAVVAAVAGVVFVIVAYGSKIAAWFKKLIGCNDVCDEACFECSDDEVFVEDAEEAAPIEEAVVEDAVEEVAADEETVVASEADFEG